MYRHILVPTDGSSLSMKAVREAARLAKDHKARITAFYAIEPYAPPPNGEAAILYPEIFSEAEYRKRTEKAAGIALKKVESEGRAAGVKVERKFVTAAAPWKAIIDEARADKCDLIVMASHGRGGLASVLLGSETLKVLTHSKTPVLVCR
jgi:nucleotide-binding universal stress UspA family protein